MEFSPDQIKTLNLINAWYNSDNKKQFLTLGGYAGTGKTTLISQFAQVLLKTNQAKLKIAFCSYTGRAAQNLKNVLKNDSILKSGNSISTIHGLIYTPIEDLAGVIVGWEKITNLDSDLIIVDEASMVDENIWLDLMSFKIPILAVGDHGQLPPINGNFNLMEKPELKIEEIHRQAKHNPIIEISMQARVTGKIQAREYGNNVIKYSHDDFDTSERSTELLSSYSENTLILCGYNSTRVRINQFVRSSLGFETPDPRPGDRVICLRNNHKKGIYNGMLGTIQTIDPAAENNYEVNIHMDDTQTTYSGKIYGPQFGSAEPINFTKNRLRAKNLDLFDFGYALTVHKAQGSQAERVILFEERFPKMTDDQWKRWLYTGVTRAIKELYIFG